jgi:yecA family protein
MKEAHFILDEHDIAELDELLSALQNEDALRLDAAQGLLAALAVGPKDVEAKTWMPVILGKNRRWIARC